MNDLFLIMQQYPEIVFRFAMLRYNTIHIRLQLLNRGLQTKDCVLSLSIPEERYTEAFLNIIKDFLQEVDK